MKNIFLDTNILLEYYCDRKYAKDVEQILDFAIDNQVILHISAGSFYTLAYQIEKHLKSLGIFGSDKLSTLRSILSNVLHLCKIDSIGNSSFEECLQHEAFKDIEDSFQFQTAVSNGCDVLLTLNEKDFSCKGDTSVLVQTPMAFISQISE